MTMYRYARTLCVAVCAASAAFAQQKVQIRNIYDRIICVVPMVGAGTADDPRRPMYAPVISKGAPPPDGIIAFTFQESDDGNYALVEFVAHDRSAFQHIFDDKQLKVFEKGKNKKDDIEKELRKFKKNFDLNTLGVGTL